MIAARLTGALVVLLAAAGAAAADPLDEPAFTASPAALLAAAAQAPGNDDVVVLREDVAQPSMPREDFLKNAPESEEGYVRVSTVLGEE